MTTKELKAIQWHCEANGFIPQLSAYPQIIFRSRDTGKETSVSIHSLVTLHAEYKKAAAKERARERRQLTKIDMRGSQLRGE